MTCLFLALHLSVRLDAHDCKRRQGIYLTLTYFSAITLPACANACFTAHAFCHAHRTLLILQRTAVWACRSGSPVCLLPNLTFIPFLYMKLSVPIFLFCRQDTFARPHTYTHIPPWYYFPTPHLPVHFHLPMQFGRCATVVCHYDHLPFCAHTRLHATHTPRTTRTHLPRAFAGTAAASLGDLPAHLRATPAPLSFSTSPHHLFLYIHTFPYTLHTTQLFGQMPYTQFFTHADTHLDRHTFCTCPPSLVQAVPPHCLYTHSFLCPLSSRTSLDLLSTSFARILRTPATAFLRHLSRSLPRGTRVRGERAIRALPARTRCRITHPLHTTPHPTTGT